MTISGMVTRLASIRTHAPPIRTALPQFLIPAKSSRHRTACLALYRRLVSLSRQVPIPNDIATAFAPTTPTPIRDLIRRSFRRNRNDTSPRLVAPALKAGYRFLTLLQSARDSSTPQYASIISFLRDRLAEGQRSRDAQAARLQKRQRQRTRKGLPRLTDEELLKDKNKIEQIRHPDAVPLITRVFPPPDGPSHNLAMGRPRTEDQRKPAIYVPTPGHRPRPQSALGGSGVRRIPHVDMARDVPLLRLKKPQPERLHPILRAKNSRALRLRSEITEFESQWLPDARLEDEWDQQMERLSIEEAERETLTTTSTQSNDTNERRGKYSRSHKIKNNNFHKATPAPSAASIPSQQAREERLQAPQPASFNQSVFIHGIQHNYAEWNYIRLDSIGRANAFREIVRQEKKLAAAEARERGSAEKKAKAKTEKDRRDWGKSLDEIRGESKLESLSRKRG